MIAPLIFFTGGGSSGHVTPNIALIEEFKTQNYRMAYVGSSTGIEASLIQPLAIDYYLISTGKLRRQWDWRNLLMPCQVLRGIWQSVWLCQRHKPQVIFSKGGFVALPLVIGAWLKRIPVLTHESDLSPGLANRLMYPFVKKIALSFPQSERYFNDKTKLCYTGSPIRASLFTGNAMSAKQSCGFLNNKPVLLVYGGGLGSVKINQAVWAALPTLLLTFNIIHACGKGKTDAAFVQAGYYQADYLNEGLADAMALADVVVSRAGANSIIELLALAKPHVLIPLAKGVSRGDQVENAAFYQALGLSHVLAESALTATHLREAIEQVWCARVSYTQKMHAYPLPDAKALLIQLIKAEVHG